jgi:antitoxin component YwqK of YwqJK toxin-antitoxin module
MFFEGQQKFIEGTYNKQQQRDGKWTSCFEDGKQNSQGTYVDGKEQGKNTVWFPNGQIHYTGKYQKVLKPENGNSTTKRVNS